jgi:hypothetical protein
MISGTGSIVLQTSVNGGFVAPTSSPAAGKMSIYISGGNVILVNKLAVATASSGLSKPAADHQAHQDIQVRIFRARTGYCLTRQTIA